jgi:hypothetical protein
VISTGAIDTAEFFCQDNGGAKTLLLIQQQPTGAAQQQQQSGLQARGKTLRQGSAGCMVLQETPLREAKNHTHFAHTLGKKSPVRTFTRPLLTGQGADDCANRIFFLGHKDTQGPSH